MSKKKVIEIPVADMGKYKKTKMEGDKVYATVYLKKGKLDEKESLSKEYYMTLHPNEKEEKEGFLAKIIKAPFRLLWWLFKKALILLSFGLLAGILNSEDEEKKQ